MIISVLGDFKFIMSVEFVVEFSPVWGFSILELIDPIGFPEIRSNSNRLYNLIYK
jgi:hypothetical protein